MSAKLKVQRPGPGKAKAKSAAGSIAARFDVTPRKIQRRLTYFRIGQDDEAAMAEIHAIIDPMAAGVIDAFYAHIGTFISLAKIIDANSSVDRLKTSLRQFMRDIGRNMDSMDYVERRLQVGLAHNKIGLKPRWYLGAYSLLQSQIRQILAEACGKDAARCLRLTETLEKVLMFDMSLGIDAYHQDAVAELKTSLEAVKKAEKILEKSARLDPLMGILNRKAFMQALQQELDRSRRYNHNTAVMFIDFDHFKAINDTHGHNFGDNVLKKVAKTIREMIRAPDIFGRYGGEELAVALVECSKEDAVMIAERIRRTIAGNVIQKRRTDVAVPVTVSIGLHFPNPSRQRASTALRYADRALYAAKKAGRNRVVVYNPEYGR